MQNGNVKFEHCQHPQGHSKYYVTSEICPSFSQLGKTRVGEPHKGNQLRLASGRLLGAPVMNGVKKFYFLLYISQWFNAQN